MYPISALYASYWEHIGQVFGLFPAYKLDIVTHLDMHSRKYDNMQGRNVSKCFKLVHIVLVYTNGALRHFQIFVLVYNTISHVYYVRQLHSLHSAVDRNSL